MEKLKIISIVNQIVVTMSIYLLSAPSTGPAPLFVSNSRSYVVHAEHTIALIVAG